VSINFSTKQLQQANLTQMLAEIIHNADVEPNSIIIEIIEQSLLENTEDTFRTLHELKQLGINVTLDDFGTGYASATHLQQFTFHKLKIAQSLLQVLKTNPEDTTMISAIIALGRTFNIKVVAGGVETQQQLDILYQFQCEIMQGYRFSQPLSLEEATELLSLHGNKSIQGKNK
jgi:EAL domain-containing protein (putative c-di-GMP-specific phosphodiesterase class I)